MSKNKAFIAAVLGATGSGKSVFIRQQLAAMKPKRLLVWNPLQATTKYEGEVITRTTDLYSRIYADGKKGFAYVFVPCFDDKLRRKQFNAFCGIALDAGNLVLIAEELRFVTSPHVSPTRWAEVTCTGRQAGLRVFGTSQRPAQIDKDFLGNATFIRTGRLGYSEDVRAVAKTMREPEDAISVLQPLEFIEKNMETGARNAGKLTFR